MKKFVLKCVCLVSIFFATVCFVNYFGDPANLYHEGIIDELVSMLASGNIVSKSGDMDNRLFQKARIKSLEETPEVVILGSSHVMYPEWEFENYYIGGVSGSTLNEIIGMLGMLDYWDKTPSHVVIGIDPYILYDGFKHDCWNIQEFIDYECSLMDGNEKEAGETGVREDFLINQLPKLKELVSLAYFQSSVRAAIGKLLHGRNIQMSIAADDEMGQQLKMLPNGRCIPSIGQIQTVEQMTNIANKEIMNKNVYYMNGFVELSEEKVKLFEQMTDYLLSKGVLVDFYLPTWYPVYYEEIKTNATLKGVLQAEEYVREMAQERGITVHGSYDPDKVDIIAQDFMDDMHLKPEAAIREYNTIVAE